MANEFDLNLSSSPRCKPLWDWLNKHNASCCWQKDITTPRTTWNAPKLTAKIECWRVGAALVIVMINEHGWLIFTEHNTNSIEDTLIDAEQRVGIRPGHDLKLACKHEWSVDEQGTRRCIGCGVPRG